jgi:predicted ferric reductase
MSAAALRAGAAPAGTHPASPRPHLLRPPLRRRWWTDAVGLAVWASLLVVAVLWERNGGVQDLTNGAGSALTSIGRLTGLLSADLMLLQVLGMARIPWAERAIGQDRLVGWHRWAGFTSFWLLTAHVVLITLGYAAVAGTGPLAEFWSLVTTAPGMLLATAGTGVIVAVVATSIRAARRRIRYESWHLLHLYAYLGVALALPHQLWTGSDFMFSPVATAYWWTMWALALGAVLVFRIGSPLVLSSRHRLVVATVTPVGPDVVALDIRGRHLERLRVASGQFFVWRFLTGTGWTRGHPLSLSSAPTTAGLRVTIGTAGDDGARLAGMRPGTPVLLEGPYGRLTADARVRPRMAVIAAGVGIAPLLALLQENAGRRTDDVPPILLFRAHDEVDLVHRGEVDRLAGAGLAHVLTLVGPRSRAGTSWLPAQFGHVPGPRALRQMIPDLERRDVFLCGPTAWTDAVLNDLRSAGVPAEALHHETFTW